VLDLTIDFGVGSLPPVAGAVKPKYCFTARDKFLPRSASRGEDTVVRTHLEKEVHDAKHVILRSVIERGPSSRVRAIDAVARVD